MTSPTLEFIRGTQVEFQLRSGGSARVGRHSTNDWVVGENSLSRFHARVEWAKGKSPQVTDLGSQNGTFVGRQRVAPNSSRELEQGGILRFGQVSFTTRWVKPGAPPALLEDDSTGGFQVFGEVARREEGRFGSWDEVHRFFDVLELKRRTGTLRIDLASGRFECLVLLGSLAIQRADGLTMLRELEAKPTGTFYSFSTSVAIGEPPSQQWRPSELISILRHGDVNLTRKLRRPPGGF